MRSSTCRGKAKGRSASSRTHRRSLPNHRYTQLIVKGSAAQEKSTFSDIGSEELAALANDPSEDWVIAHEMAHQFWELGDGRLDAVTATSIDVAARDTAQRNQTPIKVDAASLRAVRPTAPNDASTSGRRIQRQPSRHTSVRTTRTAVPSG